MRPILICLTALFALCNFAQAAEPDERAVHALARSSSLSAEEIRESYNACDSGITHSMTVCAAYTSKLEDLRVNDAYVEVLKNIKGTRAERKLRKAQSAWIAFRDATCDYESDGWTGGTGHSMVRLSCLAKLTQDRAKQLEEYAQCRSPTCPGEW